ncbi:hypothetical protein [Corynebacterium liangguodongii]|uniref:Uncharacterized protein n=1 Tax=Corynebacterium liangguodongii TaxID=2079535 RepID=A0A2S0WE27_9CORY|nr:hypothetical protein [Corynebacterium liangguodongii]AWB84037.1 hypothetical protein C3E79_05725 [Corynebacterium liangguodongii]PWC00310.1 hypothetical protein DF219_02365 [Corynebacterium liangguodongii]
MLFGNRYQGALDELIVRVAELEREVAELSSQAGRPADARRRRLASDEVRRLLGQGKKVAAIKQLREETGLGLAAAKRVVDRLEAGEDL